MTPEQATAILTTLSVWYPDELLSTSPEEVQEALQFAINAIRQENWRKIDNETIDASTKIQSDDCMWCDEGFFTRDDEIEYIEEPFEEFIREYTFCDDDCVINLRCYIDGKSLELDCSFDGWETTLKTTIDFRQIRKPSDLRKYLSPLIMQFRKKYNTEGYDFFES